MSLLSRHISPERWADLQAGRMSEHNQRKLRAHAARCARCQTAQRRVAQAQLAMAALRDAPAPELPWDSIRARLRWELSPAGSSGRRAAVAPSLGQRLRGLPMGARLGALAAAAVAGSLLLRTLTAETGTRTTQRPAPAAQAQLGQQARPGQPAQLAQPVQLAAPAQLSAVVTRVRGVVQVDGERDAAQLFERAVGQGAVLASGAGAMDLQFGEGSALALGPRSTLRLARFDSAAIELFIDGVVDLEVAPLLPGQRFVVHAGAQTVEVRGTQFRVEHRADETRVSCRHGLVHVREGARMVEVGSGLVTSAQTGQPLPSPVKLTSDELISLTLALPYRLPWEPTATLLSSSARLEVDAPLGHRVRLDGVELGDGAATVRVLRGRHLVETAPAGGAFGRAGWAEVAAGVRIARFEATLPGDPGSAGAALAEGDARRARLRRLAELRGQLDRRQLARCVRSIVKQGVSDTFVTVELAVGREGSIAYLNIVDTDLPAERAECVRSALASLRFGVGPAATLRERVEL